MKGCNVLSGWIVDRELCRAWEERFPPACPLYTTDQTKPPTIMHSTQPNEG